MFGSLSSSVSAGNPMRKKHSLNNLNHALSKETRRSPERLDWDTRAADALELARLMAPGPERREALKLASLLRCTAGARGLIFAKRGRPRK